MTNSSQISCAWIGRADPRTEYLDLALVACLDRNSGILVAARQDFDALDSRQREDVGPFDLDGVFVALLVDEIEIGKGVDRRQIRCEICPLPCGVGDDDWLALIGGPENVSPGCVIPYSPAALGFARR